MECTGLEATVVNYTELFCNILTKEITLIKLGKPSNKKSGLVMEIFRRGSDPPPPPLFLKVMEPMSTIQFWSKKGKKLNFPKTPKMAIFNINLLGKVPKSTQNPQFSSKIP